MKRAILLTVVLCCLAQPSWAAIYYVDQNHSNASDSNAGSSEVAPWLTLRRAMSVAAGDTVYVKNGTYIGSPSFRPLNSGTASAPIAFRAYQPSSGPRHRPVLDRGTPHHDPGFSAPVIEVSGTNYIIWDGFATAPFVSVRLEHTVGPIVENMIIDVGAAPFPGFENYVGIWLWTATNAIIRGNVIRNVRYFTAHQNGSAITMYEAHGTRIHNNEIYNCDTGIYDKENGVDNIKELNYIHDISGDGILYNSFVTARCGSCPVRNNVDRNNLIVNANVGVRYGVGSNGSDLSFHNNTVYNVVTGMTSSQDVPNLRIYNNIIFIRAFEGGGHYGFWSGSPPGLVSNYTDFRSLDPPADTVRIFVGGIAETLAQWQVRGFDGNSRAVDPLFVGPLFDAPPATAFQLQSGSPLRGAGRVGGVSSGASVNIGAYSSDSVVIGPGSAQPILPPPAPIGLRILR